MTGLPNDLTEPLRLLEPFPWVKAALWVIGAVLVAGVLILAWILWQRSRKSGDPAPTPTPPPAPTETGILEALATLRRRHVNTERHRQGCHALSELVRQFLEGRRGRPLTFLTAREIARALGDTNWSRLIGLISELQFGRRRPDREDFESACDLAHDMLADLTAGDAR